MSTRRVTDTIALHEVSGLTICRGGDRVAVSAATPAGLVRLIVPLSVWTATARTDCDSNGNPWPAPADPAMAEARLAALVADAGPAPAPKPRIAWPRRNREADLVKVRAIAAEIENGSTAPVSVLCGRHGITPVIYYRLFHQVSGGAPSLRERASAAIEQSYQAIVAEIAAGSQESPDVLCVRHGISRDCFYRRAQRDGIDTRTLRSKPAAIPGGFATGGLIPTPTIHPALLPKP
ncbi:hypothetical protein OPIT5_29365 [Opitutaceae bacterium TAV5]|nr:hypothetical protein OPIT5_21755 [Opitutaceae bacterium TAV5]AHF94889.1 hypothetical protein OPIT5_29365 [Opitutaceae bacterium TAV5]